MIFVENIMFICVLCSCLKKFGMMLTNLEVDALNTSDKLNTHKIFIHWVTSSDSIKDQFVCREVKSCFRKMWHIAIVVNLFL